VSGLIYTLADTLPIWRNSAVALLVAVVIGGVWLYVQVYDE
jgi:hypothetical protein